MKRNCLPLNLYHLVKRLRWKINFRRTPGHTASPDACDKKAIMNLYAFLVPFLSCHSEKKQSDWNQNLNLNINLKYPGKPFNFTDENNERQRDRDMITRALAVRSRIQVFWKKPRAFPIISASFPSLSPSPSSLISETHSGFDYSLSLAKWWSLLSFIFFLCQNLRGGFS